MSLTDFLFIILVLIRYVFDVIHPLVIQALAAASKTVDCLKVVHSMHCYFLQVGDFDCKCILLELGLAIFGHFHLDNVLLPPDNSSINSISNGFKMRKLFTTKLYFYSANYLPSSSCT